MGFIDGFWFQIGRMVGEFVLVVGTSLVIVAVVFTIIALANRPKRKK